MKDLTKFKLNKKLIRIIILIIQPVEKPQRKLGFLMFYGIIGWGEGNDKKIERRKTANGNDMHG